MSPSFAGRGGFGAARMFNQLWRRVNLKQIDFEAQKPVQLLIAGPRGDEFVSVLAAAGPPLEGVLQRIEGPSTAGSGSARALIFCPAPEENGASAKAPETSQPVFIVHVTSEDAGHHAKTSPPDHKPRAGATAHYPLSAFTLAEMRKHVLPDLAHAYGDSQIALAAQVPAFRSVVAARLTLDCAMNSLKVAAVSAVADHIPILGLITGSIASAGDTIAITALQMRMLLRIAAAFGKKAEFARIVELAPVVGGGYGWRALAREASGFIPVAGIAIKAGIAYAGSLVVGQAASYYYETGSHLPPHAVAAMYREAGERAKDMVKNFATRGSRKHDPDQTSRR
ncbi:MAG: hypothetical protein DLM53_01830 [Candidatus Eremiobacter antarcticus]|nr:hypothetical protein [Candidatus Eremiobacteraeota bacterium]MBC5808145.1 hypothetical protein [Candidatus Eremiobacteraeota bacterium]PZR63540.1 MAG: hypothetical protein DLM53_01830 [Candidatus Eremiobacter sp. RRmetagenome_bin22]